MRYALESRRETQRLRRQATAPAFSVEEELRRLPALSGKRVLDAGCGAGAVSECIARNFPGARITACDASELRVTQARRLHRRLENIHFETQDARRLSYPDAHFDLIISRLMIEHCSGAEQQRVVAEFHRCLKPRGQACLIDLDGIYVNLHPVPEELRKGMRRLQAERKVDLFAGRKLPGLLAGAGFHRLRWDVSALSFAGPSLAVERRMMSERFASGAEFFRRVLGSRRNFQSFRDAYLEALQQPGATLHYSKWIAWGTK